MTQPPELVTSPASLWQALTVAVLLVGPIMGMALFAGWKDRRFLQGKEPRPMPEWQLCALTIVVVVVCGLIARRLM